MCFHRNDVLACENINKIIDSDEYKIRQDFLWKSLSFKNVIIAPVKRNSYNIFFFGIDKDKAIGAME